ncbi:MAG: hypothetical protein EBZ49_18495, partial [Proteobacteria bacterium]|nr:hypothetical protein [Pseudomonadota bacterium]
MTTDFFSDRPPDSISGDGSVLFQQAQQFDRLLRSKLSIDEVEQLKKDCHHTGKTNPFCPGISKVRSFLKIVDQKSKASRPSSPKEITPAELQFKNGQLLNSAKLRKSSIESLLKTFSSISETELVAVSQLLKKETKCPNHAVVAAAATLEDYLPDNNQQELIADLYLQGAKCARRELVDKEHYLTRAGLFLIWKKNYKKAVSFLKKVNPMDAFSGRALYWLAIAQRESGDRNASELTFTRLLARHPLAFHSLLASQPLSSDPLANWLVDRKIDKTRSTRSPSVNPFVSEAEILKRYGFDFSASIITDWVFD